MGWSVQFSDSAFCTVTSEEECHVRQSRSASVLKAGTHDLAHHSLILILVVATLLIILDLVTTRFRRRALLRLDARRLTRVVVVNIVLVPTNASLWWRATS